jgi:uncharacterized membrane protein YkvA (DUF1232 family)
MNSSRTEYSDKKFWNKLKRFAHSAGEDVVERALLLFYALKSPKTPKWAKTVVLGALAYFIMPMDAIPDVVPVVGYTDDLGALAAALVAVRLYVTDDMKEMAKAKTKEWFGKLRRPG